MLFGFCKNGGKSLEGSEFYILSISGPMDKIHMEINNRKVWYIFNVIGDFATA